MNILKMCAAVGALFLSMSPAHAGISAVVNLCANPSTSATGCAGGVNSGNATVAASTAYPFGTTYTYNPVAVNLAAGAYTVSVVGTGVVGLNNVTSLFSAYTISAGNYSDGGWSITANGKTVGVPGVGASAPVQTTAAAALAYAQTNFNYNFFLASAQTVYFSLDDLSAPYFADDTGGVSLAIKTAVPEPMTVSLVGLGAVALVASRRRRVKQV